MKSLMPSCAESAYRPNSMLAIADLGTPKRLPAAIDSSDSFPDFWHQYGTLIIGFPPRVFAS